MYGYEDYMAYQQLACAYQAYPTQYGCNVDHLSGCGYKFEDEELRHLLYVPSRVNYPAIVDHFELPPSESSASESTKKETPSDRSSASRARSLVQFHENYSKGGSRSKRRPYNRYQLTVLESEYIDSEYITRQKRWDIACKLNLSERQIKVWFQNRRMKKKKTAERDATTT